MTTLRLSGDSPGLTGVVACVVARFAEAEGLGAGDVVGLASAVGLAIDHARRGAGDAPVEVTLLARSGGLDVEVDGVPAASRSLAQLALPDGLVDEVRFDGVDGATLRFVKRFPPPAAARA
jgi:hypothetical protein